MPHRIYQGSEPPAWWDPILAHPFELLTAAYGVVGGTLATLVVIDGRSISESTAALPAPFTVAMLAMLVLGGLLTWVGLLDHGPDLMRGWTRERMGLALTASGWAIYTLTIVASYPGSLLAWGIGATFAASSTLRLVATYREEWATRRAIQ